MFFILLLENFFLILPIMRNENACPSVALYPTQFYFKVDYHISRRCEHRESKQTRKEIDLPLSPKMTSAHLINKRNEHVFIV